MNELKIFDNPEFGKVRTIEIDGEPYFIGKDVAEILGYQNGSRDVNRHTDEEDRQKTMIFDGNQDRETIIINESGLYSLILSSKLPKAKEFKRWVTSEVLPSLRKTGSYTVPHMSEMEMIAKLASNAVNMEKTLEEQNKRIEKLENKADIPIKEIVSETLAYSCITYEQQKMIHLSAKLRVLEQLNAERSAKNQRLYYNKLYSDIRRQFGVTSFRNIRSRDYRKAICFIDEWEPPHCGKGALP
ncbi:MAG: BRO family protein [Oscillospiraceae bacterium]